MEPAHDGDDRDLFDRTSEELVVDQVETSGSDLRLLYIVLGAIVIFLLIWILLLAFSKEDTMAILTAMNTLTNSISAVSDMKII